MANGWRNWATDRQERKEKARLSSANLCASSALSAVKRLFAVASFVILLTSATAPCYNLGLWAGKKQAFGAPRCRSGVIVNQPNAGLYRMKKHTILWKRVTLLIQFLVRPIRPSDPAQPYQSRGILWGILFALAALHRGRSVYPAIVLPERRLQPVWQS